MLPTKLQAKRQGSTITIRLTWVELVDSLPRSAITFFFFGFLRDLRAFVVRIYLED